MSLFDSFKEKAAELLTGAGDKVSELTGIDLPGGAVAEQLTQTADSLTEAGQNLADTANNVGDGVTGAVGDAVDPRNR